MLATIIKRIFDLLISLLVLMVSWPILIILGLLIYLEDRGSVFFVQQRLGKGGVPFNIIKFRSMILSAEKSGTGLYSYKDDPRITRVGNFIRKTSLDELPQVFNVIRGEMSIVGPRPPVVYELGPWQDYTPDMLERFKVKPGITGLAQISGRNENDWDAKIIFDNKYVFLYQKYNILIDIKILFFTVGALFRSGDTIEPSVRGDDGPISRKARIASEKYLNKKN